MPLDVPVSTCALGRDESSKRTERATTLEQRELWRTTRAFPRLDAHYRLPHAACSSMCIVWCKCNRCLPPHVQRNYSGIIRHQMTRATHQPLLIVLSCQTCDVRPAMTYGSHLTCMGTLQAHFLRQHGHYDLMGPLPTAVVHRGVHDGRCWL